MESQDIEKQVQELDEWMKSDLDSRELKRALGGSRLVSLKKFTQKVLSVL
jgi:hypothetical protein